MTNKYLVEFLGTLLLSFVIFATGNYLAIGAALAAAVLLGGKISGGAFNPAVALAMFSAGKLPQKELLPYMAVEMLGAVAGLKLSKYIGNKGR